MRSRRSFSPEFKRQVVTELLSRQEGASRICRRYHISWNLLYSWKRQIADNDMRQNAQRLYEQLQVLRMDNAALIGVMGAAERPTLPQAPLTGTESQEPEREPVTLEI